MRSGRKARRRVGLLQRSRARLIGAGLLAMATSGACSANQPTESASQKLESAPADRPLTVPPPDQESFSASDSLRSCVVVGQALRGSVKSADLTEASGLVASRSHAQVLWSHNDAGTPTGVFALTSSGEDLGFHQLEGVNGFDLEDIAYNDGKLYLADTGDNTLSRQSVRVYVFDEPDPASPGSVEQVTTLQLFYPDQPENAEAVFVDPISGDLFLVSKDLGPDGSIRAGEARVYRAPLQQVSGPLESEPSHDLNLEYVATIDLSALAARSAAGSPSLASATLAPLANVVTAADITASGHTIALRTYASTWFFRRGLDQTVAEALASDPCEGPFHLEPQGESIAIVPSANDRRLSYMTVSEGGNSRLFNSLIELAS